MAGIRIKLATSYYVHTYLYVCYYIMGLLGREENWTVLHGSSNQKQKSNKKE